MTTTPMTPQQSLEDELKKEAVPAPAPAPKPEAPAAPAPRRRGRPRKTEAEKKASAAKRTRAKKSSSAKTKAASKKSAPKKDLLFALDIGTRSVIGIVAEELPDGSLKIIATDRQEHRTRAMLDGQIHDVPQVAAVIRQVKERLEAKVGPLRSAAVAAAGRALYTMTATAEKDFHGVISSAQERDLDFAGVQTAQAKLAASHTVDDPTHYYCVGYSTIRYELDGSPLKSLVGQRGDSAKAEVIATFLPRQVIDSMQSALASVGLEMRALTLEPIAAINVLIPPTMRHLNLVLVDIGAGTSDVAITKNGSVRRRNHRGHQPELPPRLQRRRVREARGRAWRKSRVLRHPRRELRPRGRRCHQARAALHPRPRGLHRERDHEAQRAGAAGRHARRRRVADADAQGLRRRSARNA